METMRSRSQYHLYSIIPKLDDTPHYKFCKTFFEHGEKEALKIESYCPVDLKSHRDLFAHLPEGLDREPIWWLMPWGGTVRKPDFNKENV